MQKANLVFDCKCEVRVWQNGELGLGNICEKHLKQIKALPSLTEEERQQVRRPFF